MKSKTHKSLVLILSIVALISSSLITYSQDGTQPKMTSESSEVVTEQETESTNAISNVVTKNYLILIESEAQRENVQKFKAFKEFNGFTVTVKSVESDLPVNLNCNALKLGILTIKKGHVRKIQGALSL